MSRTFTQAQAEAKRGKPVRARRSSLAKYGIPSGLNGKVVEALAPYTTQATLKEEGWFVYVKFELPEGRTQILRLDKTEYERALEEL
ncbi:MAG TPA: hypothetical protein VKK81_12735 [Candidatus Binatia bacterium]|nr:hypothetical protein [Candidatus Binatia bacterium]